MMAWCKTIGKRRELCMDTSVSYIAKPRGAIAFVIKPAAVFFEGQRLSWERLPDWIFLTPIARVLISSLTSPRTARGDFRCRS